MRPMPYSALAVLMILTTVLLSACAQDEVAALEDRSGNYYGRSQVANAIRNSVVFVPSFEARNVPPAPVDSVTARELAPATKPVIAAKGQPQSMSRPMMQPAAVSWQWPVNGTVTTRFGKQSEGIANEGITIAAKEGAPIHAAASGQVAYVGNNLRDFGNLVILRHPDGAMSSYAHADRIIVAKGMTVYQGDTIGYVGQTGRAKTPQLHFAVRSGDKAVDPLSKLPRQLASVN